jgi:hypothetical protein
MKSLKFILLTISVGSAFTFLSCDNSSSSESVEEKQFIKLAKTWTLKAVTLDNNPKQLSDFPGFQLAITGTKGDKTFAYKTTFSSQARPLSPWKSAGSWAFGGDPTAMIVRDSGSQDQLPINYTVDATKLILSFNFTGGGYTSRSNLVGGNWVYTFE